MQALILSHLLPLWGRRCVENLGDLIQSACTSLLILLQAFQLTKRIHLTLYTLDTSYEGKTHVTVVTYEGCPVLYGTSVSIRAMQWLS